LKKKSTTKKQHLLSSSRVNVIKNGGGERGVSVFASCDEDKRNANIGMDIHN
jgi:hypothetical protein